MADSIGSVVLPPDAAVYEKPLTESDKIICLLVHK